MSQPRPVRVLARCDRQVLVEVGRRAVARLELWPGELTGGERTLSRDIDPAEIVSVAVDLASLAIHPCDGQDGYGCTSFGPLSGDRDPLAFHGFVLYRAAPVWRASREGNYCIDCCAYPPR